MTVEGPIIEEVEGLKEIKVTTKDENGQPQVISVFAEGGSFKGLPQSLLELGEGMNKSTGQRNVPQVIIQEITLPEGMTLDQSLMMPNANVEVKRVTPRGTSK